MQPEDDELSFPLDWEDGLPRTEEGWAVQADRPVWDVESESWGLIVRAYHDDLGPWWVQMAFLLSSKGFYLTDVAFKLKLGSTDLGGSLLKRLRLGQAMKAVQATIKTLEPPEGVDHRAWAVQMPKPGRTGLPELFYAEWVRDYLEAIAKHGQRGFWPDLMEGHDDYNVQQVRGIIIRAEELGLIGERPGSGKAGGVMTDKCANILQRVCNAEET